LELIRSIHRQFREQIVDELERLRNLESSAKSEIYSAEWVLRLAQLSKQGLSPETEAELSKLNFNRIGEFRGLRNVISRVMLGSSLTDAVLNTERSGKPAEDIGEPDLHCIDVLTQVLNSPTLSIGWRRYRVQWANQLNQLLLSHSSKVENVIHAASKKRSEVKKQLENLLRSESSDSSGGIE
jgi:hypothetical protein